MDRLELIDENFAFSSTSTRATLKINVDVHGQQRQAKQEILENQKLRVKLNEYVEYLHGIDTPEEVDLKDDLIRMLRGDK